MLIQIQSGKIFNIFIKLISAFWRLFSVSRFVVVWRMFKISLNYKNTFVWQMACHWPTHLARSSIFLTSEYVLSTWDTVRPQGSHFSEAKKSRKFFHNQLKAKFWIGFKLCQLFNQIYKRVTRAVSLNYTSTVRMRDAARANLLVTCISLQTTSRICPRKALVKIFIMFPLVRLTLCFYQSS